MKVKLQETTLRDVESWLIAEIRGEKSKRGEGSIVSDENAISSKLEAEGKNLINKIS